MLLSCQNVGKSFGVTQILEDVTFMLEEKEKAALVGVNGAGKTTLFRILTGEYAPDSGQVVFSKDLTLGYLEQINQMDGDNSIFDEMLTVFAEVIALEDLMRELEVSMAEASGTELEKLMERYARASETFEQRDGYSYKSRIRGVIKGLGFTEDEFLQPIYQLSGGQKTRVALGRLLLSEPDLLLLDEPTNHLDIEAIEWLEDFLRNYPRGVLIISHDRYFLDRIVNKVIEVENRKSVVYGGNYTAYAAKKIIVREIALKHYFNQQKEIKRQEEVITKLKSFNREKSIKRAESREKLLSKIERIERPEDLPDQMRLTLTPKHESGFDVLTVTEARKVFDGDELFRNISFEIKKSEKVALIGANGIGKTTLLRMILNKMPFDGGSAKLGTGVNIQYYDQEHQELDEGKTIFQDIYDAYPKLTVLEIRNALAAFMFTGDDVYKSIGQLSGGERGRVSLAKIMLGKANFLLLDEPTNHLDIYSKEILEQALRDYTGTVLYISHDRYFINNTAEKIIELTPVGAEVYAGNYDYYLDKKRAAVPSPVQTEQQTQKASADWAKQKELQTEGRRNKTRLQKTEQAIDKAEQRLKELDALLLQPEIGADAQKAHELYLERQGIEEILHELYEEWENLSE